MATSQRTPVPRDKMLGDDGFVTRTWYRWFLELGNQSGQLSQPVTIAPNQIFISGTIQAGDTVTVADMPANTLLGNAENVAAPAEPITVDASLTFENGSLAAGNILPLSLSGNPLGVVAPPTSIAIDITTLQIINGTLTAIGGGGGSGISFAEAAAMMTWGG